MAMRPGPDGVRVERRGAFRVEVTEGVSVDAVLDALEAPGEVLKESPKWLTKRVGDWVVKASPPGQGLRTLKYALLRGRFRRAAWNAALVLQARGVGVPQPRAFVERRRLGMATGFATVSDYLGGCVNVEEHARGLVAKGASEEEVLAFLLPLGDAINGFNRSGAYHSDMKGANILTADGQAFWFIDLDAVSLTRPYGPKLRLRNHIQLYDSFCDWWGPELLGPFLERMLPEGPSLSEWLERVQEGQRRRRSRHERKQVG